MNSLDLQVILQGLEWLRQGRQVWLSTVLSTYGSAPRGPGAMLVALETGDFRGSLSGGCVEEDFLERLGLGEFGSHSQVVRYGEGGLTPSRELPCGGVLDVLIERFDSDCEALEHFSTMLNSLEGRSLSVRHVVLGTNIRKLEVPFAPAAAVVVTGEKISIQIGAAKRLLVAGLSPVAEFCASFAVSLGFEVIVCDPRLELTSRFSLDGAKVVEALPATYISQGGCHAATAVVALTHDPRLDDLTLLEAVRTSAFYIGAMGSLRTSEKRLERVRKIGCLTDDSVSRIRAPIGLNLGSKTPGEIALAVMSDIVRVSNGIPRDSL